MTNPPRLRDERGKAREGLDGLAAVEMPAATRERLAKKLGITPPPPASGGAALKIAGGLGAIVVVVGAIVWWARQPTPQPAPAVVAPVPVLSTPKAEERPEPSIAASTPSATAIRKPPPVAPPPDEATLFRRAGDALRDGDPSRALRLVDEQARLYPNGTFVQEREVLRIDALTALGKNDDARSRARAFLAQYPDSPHRVRLERMLSQ